MIDTIATRRTTLNGQSYNQGDKVSMPLQQFEDLEPTGLFERAKTEKARRATKSSRTAPAAEPTSSTPAD